LTFNIERMPRKHTGPRKPADPNSEPNFYDMIAMPALDHENTNITSTSGSSSHESQNLVQSRPVTATSSSSSYFPTPSFSPESEERELPRARRTVHGRPAAKAASSSCSARSSCLSTDLPETLVTNDGHHQLSRSSKRSQQQGQHWPLEPQEEDYNRGPPNSLMSLSRLDSDDIRYLQELDRRLLADHADANDSAANRIQEQHGSSQPQRVLRTTAAGGVAIPSTSMRRQEEVQQPIQSTTIYCKDDLEPYATFPE
jgi:hypothetical protein